MSRFFKEMNTGHGSVCPICNTSKPGKVLLVPILGTEDDGISEAKQYHADCVHIAALCLLDALESERLEQLTPVSE